MPCWHELQMVLHKILSSDSHNNNVQNHDYYSNHNFHNNNHYNHNHNHNHNNNNYNYYAKFPEMALMQHRILLWNWLPGNSYNDDNHKNNTNYTTTTLQHHLLLWDSVSWNPLSRKKNDHFNSNNKRKSRTRKYSGQGQKKSLKELS